MKKLTYFIMKDRCSMLKVTSFICVLFMFAICPLVKSEEQKINRYMGASACEACHLSQSRSFKVYARKSRSFSSIKKMEKGLTSKEINGCYACHTTGYGKPGGFESLETTPELKNASCEVCHGPGERHIQTQDPDDIGRDVTIAICHRCHTEERVQSFRYKPIIYAGSH